jgi:hypothetical protein
MSGHQYRGPTRPGAASSQSRPEKRPSAVSWLPSAGVASAVPDQGEQDAAHGGEHGAVALDLHRGAQPSTEKASLPPESAVQKWARNDNSCCRTR